MAAKPRIILASPGGAADPPFCRALRADVLDCMERLRQGGYTMILNRTHLDQLENQSIFIFREAYHAFKKIAMS
jgi:hypothetical protein